MSILAVTSHRLNHFSFFPFRDHKQLHFQKVAARFQQMGLGDPKPLSKSAVKRIQGTISAGLLRDIFDNSFLDQNSKSRDSLLREKVKRYLFQNNSFSSLYRGIQAELRPDSDDPIDDMNRVARAYLILSVVDTFIQGKYETKPSVTQLIYDLFTRLFSYSYHSAFCDAIRFEESAIDAMINPAIEFSKQTKSLVEKAAILARIAKMQAKSYPTQSKQNFRQAIETALQNERPRDQSKALVKIAKTLPSLHPTIFQPIYQLLIESVEKISAEESKNGTFSKMAETLSENYPQQAADIVNHIQDLFQKIETLRKMAKKQASSREEQSNQNLLTALNLAKTITVPVLKTASLKGITDLLTLTNPTQALKVACLIPSARERSDSMTTIASTLTSTRPKQALKAITLIENPTEKTKSLIKMATARAKTTPENAKEHLIAATKSAQTIKTKDKFHYLTEIALLQMTLDPKNALPTAELIKNSYALALCLTKIALRHQQPESRLDIALTVAKKIQDPIFKTTCLIEIARLLAERLPEDSKKVIALANQLLSTIEENPLKKANALLQIAEIQIAIDPKASLQALFDQINELLKEVNIYRKDSTLQKLALLQALFNLNDAYTTIEQIQNPIVKANTFKKIAISLIKTDTKKALEVTQQITNTNRIKDETLLEIISFLTKKDLKKAVQTTLFLTDLDLQAKTLRTLAFIQTETNTSKALETANRIKDSVIKAKTIKKIAIALAQFDLKEALTIASQMESPYYKAITLTEIAALA